MKKSDMWIAIAASLGVGAATFYSMSKSQKPLNKAVESVTPVLSSMAGNSSQQQSNQNQNHSTTETMGPFGMS